MAFHSVDDLAKRYFVACVHDPDTDYIRIYSDITGSLAENDNLNYSIVPVIPNSTLFISVDSGNDHFDGLLDEMSMWNTNLSFSEIEWLYNGGDGRAYADLGEVQVERDALIALYNSTDGDNWDNNTGWGIGDPCDPEWYGVDCDAGHVTGLDLSYNQLSGPIPAELGDLSGLVYLSLRLNQLSGPIPPEMGNLSSLLDLYLSNNQLSGSIPPEMGNLSNLEDLRLQNNQLTGPIPAELGNLSSLDRLHLYNNQLSGPIPAELGNLSSLEDLQLDNNQLSGPIPAELGNLSSLLNLYLSRNQLTGPIPAELGNPSNLEILDLFNNQLSGSIPPELGNLSSLLRLDLPFNQLTGPIPAELGNLSNLKYLHLSVNQLSGPIPIELSNLSNLWGLYLTSNQLGGLIPTELTNLNNLSLLFLGYNMLTASDPVLIEFLNIKNPNWADTQTVAPTNLQIDAVGVSSIEISWTPIIYTGDGGYYEIAYATVSGGPYSVHGLTADKLASSYLVGGLVVDTVYYLVVRSYTPAHPAHNTQLNDLWSDWSDEVAAYTSSVEAAILGAVRLQGRGDHSGAVVTTWDDGATVDSFVTASSGFYTQTMPGGTYSLTVEMARYLDSEYMGMPVNAGEAYIFDQLNLPGGDANDDDIVNIFDLSFMGGRYRFSCGDPGWDERADINDDCTVNIQDLSIAGGNYLKTSPVPWPGQRSASN
jgi:Leucine-rich repeat (LRR) protein